MNNWKCTKIVSFSRLIDPAITRQFFKSISSIGDSRDRNSTSILRIGQVFTKFLTSVLRNVSSGNRNKPDEEDFFEDFRPDVRVNLSEKKNSTEEKSKENSKSSENFETDLRVNLSKEINSSEENSSEENSSEENSSEENSSEENSKKDEKLKEKVSQENSVDKMPVEKEEFTTVTVTVEQTSESNEIR